MTIGAVGVAATKVARGELLPTGVFGRSNEAGTEVGALPDFTAGLTAAGEAGGTLEIGFAASLRDLAGAMGGADLVVVLFDVTFGGAFKSLEGDDFEGAFAATFGVCFALEPFAVAFTAFVPFVAFASGFTTGFILIGALAVLAFTLAFGGAIFAFETALPFATGLAGAFFFTTLIALVTFVDFPLTLLLVAVLAFFAVANLISSAVFLLFFVTTRSGQRNFENA